MRGLGLGLRFGRGRPFAFISYGDDFVFTVETTAPDETFTLPCQNVGTFNATMDHGDGSVSSITAYNDADLAHTYANAGIHEVRIRGTFPNVYFNNSGDKLKVRSVVQLGKVGWTRLDKAFYGCIYMTSFLCGSSCDTSNVVNMAYMLTGCAYLSEINVSRIDTGKVESMAGEFQGCTLIDTDISGFDFSVVTNLTNFLYDADAMSAGNLDLLLASIYAQRASITWATPALDISSLDNDPTGVYQDATPPTTGLEYVYKLVNDPDAEGFNVWTITY